MDILIMPRLLLIAGTGRNSGKTTLACQVIRKYCDLFPITAIKISPHFHKNVQSGKILLDTGHLYIAEETNRSLSKDSSKMLEAGAHKSYFIMSGREHTREAFSEVMGLCSDKDFLVCESGGLRNFVIPGVFLMMKNSIMEDDKPATQQLKELADCLITFDGQKTDFNIDNIIISENRWKLQKLIV